MMKKEKMDFEKLMEDKPLFVHAIMPAVAVFSMIAVLLGSIAVINAVV
jgi:hypothetical protein